MNKVLVCVVLCNIFVQIDSTKQNSRDLALETTLRFGGKHRATDLNLIDSVQVFPHKVKQVRLKNSPKRRKQIHKKNIFTNFLLCMFYIIKEYKDEDLEQIITILDDAVRKFKNESHNLHGLIGNKDILYRLDDQLEHLRGTPNDEIRNFLENIIDFLQKDQMPDNVKDLLDFISTLYDTDTADKLVTLVNNLEIFKNKAKRMNSIDYNGLLKQTRQNLDTVIFDLFRNISPDYRKEFKMKLNTAWVGCGTSRDETANKAKFRVNLVSNPNKSRKKENVVTYMPSGKETGEKYVYKIKDNYAKMNDKSYKDVKEESRIEEKIPTDFEWAPHEKIPVKIDGVKTKQRKRTQTKIEKTFRKSLKVPRDIHKIKNMFLDFFDFRSQIGLSRNDYKYKDNNRRSNKDVKSFVHSEQSSINENNIDRLVKEETIRQNLDKDRKSNAKYSSEKEVMSDFHKVFVKKEQPTTTTVNLSNINKRLDLIENLLIDLKNKMEVMKNVKQDNTPVTLTISRTAFSSSLSRRTTSSESTSVRLIIESSTTSPSILKTDLNQRLHEEMSHVSDSLLNETMTSNVRLSDADDTALTTTESRLTTAAEINVIDENEFNTPPDYK